MKKQTYILPKIETMVLPADALMDPIALTGSPDGPALGNAPARRQKNPTQTPAF